LQVSYLTVLWSTPKIITDAMQVVYTFITAPTPLQVEGVLELYRLQGWWGPPTDHDPELAEAIIRGSHCFVVASHEGSVIGMGRAISDRASDAYIQDLAVRFAFRGNGIGTRMVNELITRLRSDGLGWIGLVAEAGTWDFYRRTGFAEMPGSVLMLKKNL
jgi:ribosomal protein S18 acetylase RimI-like enzyme